MLGWDGPLYPVTPRYEEINGLKCYARMADLPQTVDLAIISGSVARLEQDMRSALDAGARSLVAYSTPQVSEDADLPARIMAMARDAGVPMLGPNTIGYVNYAHGTVSTWVPPSPGEAGNVAAIVQSGSLYSFATLTDPRIKVCFTAHPAQEANVSVAEIIDYVVDLPETEVLGLYLEIVREPQAFAAALAKAEAKGIPLVVLKPGRSEAARSAISTHTGRMAAPDAILDALFHKHHAHRVGSLDEWWTTLALFAGVRDIGPGGLAVLTDSGGQRALLMDEAHTLGVPLAQFEAKTRRSLRKRLAPDLAPENPIDFWGGEEALVEHIGGLLGDALADPDTAIAMVMTEYGAVTSDLFTNKVAEGTVQGAQDSAKPVVAGTFSARQFHSERTLDLVAKGVPVLDGTPMAMRAIRHGFRWRDRGKLTPRAPVPAAADPGSVLKAARSGREADALALLAHYGMDTVQSRMCRSERDLAGAFEELTPPVVLKTAEGHAHKVDVAGVVLNLTDFDEVAAAYDQMAGRLGPAVTLQEMAPPGVEVALGVVNDPEYGPVLMAASGGTLIELVDDKTFALAPVGRTEAGAMVESLKCASLFEGHRGRPPVDRAALVAAILALSDLACECGDRLAAVDINPVIVHPGGATAVDALIEFKAG